MGRIVAAVAFSVVVAACANGDGTEPAGRGRLAILDADGDVLVLDDAADATIEITDDAGSSAIYFQPTWSPDGSQLVFSRTSAGGAELVVHDVATGTSSAAATTNPAFYFSWAPSGERIAYLANAASGTGLELAVVDSAAAEERSDAGQPYYFSWGEDDAMVVHVGIDRLDVVDADGEAREWDVGPPGAFRAPHWLEAGILYLERVGDGQQMVLAPPGEERRVIAELSGGASFVPSPAGDRVAVQVVDPSQDDQFAVTGRLATVRPSADRTPAEPPANRPVVIDFETFAVELVGSAPAVAYWWDPAGTRLLVLGVHDRAAGELEWRLWSDGELGDPVVFVPRPELVRDVLPFFDQYAQSASLWAPDGSGFAFPGAVDGDGGIYIVDVDGTSAAAPRKVADGSWVVWGP